MTKNPIGFSKKTLKHLTKEKIKKEILNSVKRDPKTRAEIARVFQKANRRIQNIENADIVSPAVIALNKGDIQGFSKFHFTGYTWEEVKIEYGKAVSFLQQPTSSLSGAREYRNHLKTTYNLSEEEYQLMENNLMGKIASVSDERFLEQYLMRYKDFTGELETESKDVSEQIESEAVSIAKAVDSKINSDADAVSDEVQSNIDKIVSYFDKFGLL